MKSMLKERKRLSNRKSITTELKEPGVKSLPFLSMERLLVNSTTTKFSTESTDSIPKEEEKSLVTEDIF
jgi:hypothetical protein